MKFSPTVAEMAEMSPMCSIMEATAMGGHHQDGGQVKLGHAAGKIGKEGLQAQDGILSPSRVLPDRPVKSTMPASRAAT